MTLESKPGSNDSWPLVSIVIINSRGGEMFDEALQSVRNLFYPKMEIIVEENLQRTRTIGKCWNDAVKDSKGEYVLFVGDDDRVSQDYLISLILYAKTANKHDTTNSIVAYTTYCTAFSHEYQAGMQKTPTGMWKRDYLIENPFDETLLRHVDSEYYERSRNNNKMIVTIPHQFGYYYRQHNDKVSGNQVAQIEEGKLTLNRKVDGGIYMVARYISFIKPLENELSKNYKILLALAFSEEQARDSKLMWSDWADDNAVKMSWFKTDIPKILRVRSYETYEQWMEQINWDAFEYILFTVKHVQDFVEARLGIKFGERARIIPNGVNLDKFLLPEGKVKNNKIAWTGFLANKKGVQLLLFVARHLPEYEFHIAGTFQEKDVERLFYETKPDNVFYHGYQADMNQFYSDKTYVLNTSPREGNPNSVMEGMACGLKPLIYRWIGAESIYGEMTWDTLDELEALLETDVEPERYRLFIRENYDFRKSIEKIKYLIDKLCPTK